jgi:hypothetical protein
MIKYCLVENALSENNKNYLAKVYRLENKDLDDVIKYMVEEGSGLTRHQAMAYFERLSQAVMRFTEEGCSVSTPLFQVRTTISGVFDDLFDCYDADRHQLHIRVSAGKRLQKFTKKIKVKKVSKSLNSPCLKSFIDAVSDKENLTATPGSLGKLVGSNLKFDPNDTRQGVFFVSCENNRVQYRAAVYSGVTPSAVHLQIPILPVGKYSVEIRSLSRSKKNLMSDLLYKKLDVLA